MASALFESVKASFEAEEWAYSEVEGQEVILAGFEAQHLNIELHVQVFEGIGSVSVVSESARAAYSPALA